MSKKETQGLPISILFDDPYFQRHYEMIMKEPEGATDTKLKKAITTELILRARNGIKFSGREKGAIGSATNHIVQLAKENRSLSAKQLLHIADKSIIGKMSVRTFENHVTEARKQYPKEKKATK